MVINKKKNLASSDSGSGSGSGSYHNGLMQIEENKCSQNSLMSFSIYTYDIYIFIYILEKNLEAMLTFKPMSTTKERLRFTLQICKNIHISEEDVKFESNIFNSLFGSPNI